MVTPDDVDGVRFLDDVRVLEIASLAPSMLGMHLADLGAEVIKVEPPARGDATRLVARRPPFRDSGLHRRWNRGKKSLAVDTGAPEGVDLLRRLIPHVDIVIEGLRPGMLARLGLDWPALVALKPDLVLVALSGYGQTGPYRDLPSHGVGFDAISGLTTVVDDEQGRPRLDTGHVYHGTLLAPLFGATGALAALSWSRRTGKPVLLDVAQADASVFANFGVEDAATERRAPAARAEPPTGAPRQPGRTTTQAYRTRDGKVLLLMALEQKFFARLASAIGRPDLLAEVAEDEYLVRGSVEIDEALVEIVATRDLDEWMEILAAADVPAVPVNDTDQVLDDPHLRTRLTWLDADDGAVTLKSPVEAEPPLASPAVAPAVGQHTVDVLTAIGVAPAEIDRLARQRVIRVSSDQPRSTIDENRGAS
jgi:crotonobetainyl-CoA:carnitine CoA-transferase CaiB-like acyl-CoA transferase